MALAAGLGPSSVDFVYLDPPFHTGRVHRTPPGAERRENASSLVPRASSLVPSSFSDVFESTSAYVAWLRERLVATRAAMKASAVVAVHCDFRVSHHVRLLMDELYTPHCFVNHLIWHYGLGGSSPRRFARKHDDIIVYCLAPELYYFEPPMVKATSQKMKGKMKKATDVVRIEKEEKREDAEKTPLGEWGYPKAKTSEAEERRMDSLIEVASLNNMARERTGYPTQKPLALLELLVGAFCPRGGTVLDPTCGSGTTLVAAKKLGREAIGFDVSADAVDVARGRLLAADA